MSLNKIVDHIFSVFDFGQLTSIVSCFVMFYETAWKLLEPMTTQAGIPGNQALGIGVFKLQI